MAQAESLLELPAAGQTAQFLQCHPQTTADFTRVLQAQRAQQAAAAGPSPEANGNGHAQPAAAAEAEPEMAEVRCLCTATQQISVCEGCVCVCSKETGEVRWWTRARAHLYAACCVQPPEVLLLPQPFAQHGLALCRAWTPTSSQSLWTR